MITAEVYALVLPAVQMILQDKGYTADTMDIDTLTHNALWPYVTHAVRESLPSDPSAALPAPPQRDGRVKTWEYVVRFWAM